MATPQQQEALFREGRVDLGVQAYKPGQITTFCDRVLGRVGHMLVWATCLWITLENGANLINKI